MFVLTSNKHKIKEYREFGLKCRLWPDLDEVQGTIDEVIIYKILSAPPEVLVEDTVLEVEGEQIVDAKFRLKELLIGQNSAWITSLGYHDDLFIYVFRGCIKGTITSPVIQLSRSFEPCFIPEGADITLHELKLKGEKHKYSARQIAVQSFRNSEPAFQLKISDVSSWSGKYQNKNYRR